MRDATEKQEVGLPRTQTEVLLREILEELKQIRKELTLRPLPTRDNNGRVSTGF